MYVHTYICNEHTNIDGGGRKGEWESTEFMDFHFNISSKCIGPVASVL